MKIAFSNTQAICGIGRTTLHSQFLMEGTRVILKASIMVITSISLESLTPINLEKDISMSHLSLRSTPPIAVGPYLPLAAPSILNFNTPNFRGRWETMLLEIKGQQLIHASQFLRISKRLKLENSLWHTTHWSIFKNSPSKITWIDEAGPWEISHSFPSKGIHKLQKE